MLSLACPELSMRLAKPLHDLSCNQSGNVALLFAAALLPILLVGGVAVDLVSAVKVKTQLQVAVDGSALAGAAAFQDAETDQLKQAKQFFHAYDHFPDAEPLITIGETTVTVSSKTAVPASFLTVVGVDATEVTATATAEIIGEPVCVFALNPTAAGAVKLWGSTAAIEATGCIVQANSTSATALENTSNEDSHATKFCTVGGYSGSS